MGNNSALSRQRACSAQLCNEDLSLGLYEGSHLIVQDL